jgi:hypothetical protein
MTDKCNNLVAEQIVSFLTGIGLEITKGEIQQTTFLPGIAVDRGALTVDESKLLYPGDLLHWESNHIRI